MVGSWPVSLLEMVLSMACCRWRIRDWRRTCGWIAGRGVFEGGRCQVGRHTAGACVDRGDCDDDDVVVDVVIVVVAGAGGGIGI